MRGRIAIILLVLVSGTALGIPHPGERRLEKLRDLLKGFDERHDSEDDDRIAREFSSFRSLDEKPDNTGRLDLMEEDSEFGNLRELMGETEDKDKIARWNSDSIDQMEELDNTVGNEGERRLEKLRDLLKGFDERHDSEDDDRIAREFSSRSLDEKPDNTGRLDLMEEDSEFGNLRELMGETEDKDKIARWDSDSIDQMEELDNTVGNEVERRLEKLRDLLKGFDERQDSEDDDRIAREFSSRSLDEKPDNTGRLDLMEEDSEFGNLRELMGETEDKDKIARWDSDSIDQMEELDNTVGNEEKGVLEELRDLMRSVDHSDGESGDGVPNMPEAVREIAPKSSYDDSKETAFKEDNAIDLEEMLRRIASKRGLEEA
ncbi:hypothetical protein ScPMuIL_005610 [Solemya velum]